MRVGSDVRIAELIKAHVPVIVYVTHEEGRAVGVLQRIQKESTRPRPLWTWDITTPLTRYGSEEAAIAKDTESPQGVLGYILSQDRAKDLGVYVLFDFHHFLRGSDADPSIVRMIRTAAKKLTEQQKTIVLVVPYIELPNDLEKEVAVVELEYPNEEVLSRALDALVVALQKSPSASGKLGMTPEQRRDCINAGLGLTRAEFDTAAVVSIARMNCFDPQTIAAEKAGIVKKGGILELVDTDLGEGDVGGLDVLKHWVHKRRDAFSERAKKFKLDPPKGVLLTGIPGTGKSLMAKVIANTWKLPLIRFDLASVYGSLVGQSEQNVKNVFRVAEATAPCLLWLNVGPA